MNCILSLIKIYKVYKELYCLPIRFLLIKTFHKTIIKPLLFLQIFRVYLKVMKL